MQRRDKIDFEIVSTQNFVGNTVVVMDSFCSLQRELLKLEHEAEKAEALACLDTATNVPNAKVVDVTTGLFGKTIVLFSVKTNLNVSSGDVVGVFVKSAKDPLLSGVVWSADPKGIRIVLDDPDDYAKLPDTYVSIVKLGNSVTHKRLMHTVNDLEKSIHPLVTYLDSQNNICSDESSKYEQYVDSTLNESQSSAVTSCLNSPLLSVIHGPPGTGKTTTLAATIAALVKRNPDIRILACAPSNVATDNLAIKTLQAGVRKIVRVGHPTRVHADLLSHTLDAQVRNSDFYESCRDIENQVRGLLKERYKYAEIKTLRKDLKERESKSVQQVINNANVVFTTCNGSFNIVRKFYQSNFLFDICVIDECAQGLEMSCWIPILQSKSIILGGDHQQLSATIISPVAAEKGLGISLFEKCLKLKGHDMTLLNIQYRMHADIMGWSNAQFYSGKLVAHESVSERHLVVLDKELMHDNIDISSIVESPFVFCDTCGVEGMSETSYLTSKSNIGEVGVVKTFVNLIASIRVPVTVISPYLKQTELLRDAFDSPEYPHVSTIDSFQGRESSVVVISLVRSNSEKSVGFLSDYRRLNVAVTRAQQQVFIVGDSETICSDPILKSLYDYASDFGNVVSAEMFKHEEYFGESKLTNFQPKLIKPPSQTKSSTVLPRVRRGESLNVSVVPPAHARTPIVPAQNAAIVPKIPENFAASAPKVHVNVEAKTEAKPPAARPPKPFAVQAVKTLKPAAPITIKPAGTCPFGTCMMRTTLIALHCDYCSKDFCVPHALPEVHGCDQLVSIQAKKDIKKAMKNLKAPSPVIPKKGPVAGLQAKMDTKLDKLKESRSKQK